MNMIKAKLFQVLKFYSNHPHVYLWADHRQGHFACEVNLIEFRNIKVVMVFIECNEKCYDYIQMKKAH